MKKLLFILALFMGLSSYAQQQDSYGHYQGDLSELLEASDYYQITPEQRAKIIARKKSIGREMAAIGKDRSLSGYQKGQKKRELSIQIKKDIQIILSQGQYNKWNNHWNSGKYGHKGDHWKYDKDYTNDAIDRQIDLLEDQYERDIEWVEKRYKNDKYALKSEKQYLKTVFKAEKQRLKDLKK
ncbi:hypothetical protein [Myroides sp. LJL119]